MKKLFQKFFCSICGSLVLEPAHCLATTAPGAGEYYFIGDPETIKPTPSGLNCSQITQLHGILYYPGPSAVGAVVRSTMAFGIQKNSLPRTPAVGDVEWSGTEIVTFSSTAPSYSIPFKMTMSFFDEASFTYVLIEKIPVAGGICTITSSGTALRYSP